MSQNYAAIAEAENSFYEYPGKKYPHSVDLYLPDLNIEIVGCDNLRLPDLNIRTGCDGLQLPDLNIEMVGCEENYFTDENSYRNSTGIRCPNKFSQDCVALHNSSALTMNSQLPNNDRPMNNHEQSALYTDPTIRSKNFDMILLRCKNKNESILREAMKKNIANHKKSRGKKRKTNTVDLIYLLKICAESIIDNNRSQSNEYLKDIRWFSSPTGDWTERLAYYFADALEARMNGYGTQIYRDLFSFPVSAAEVLKTYEVYTAACPYEKISTSFSNKIIWKAAKNAMRLHIVDFGILYGFQWPSLIQKLSSRPGGPPRLRITGIDLPHPGFRSTERVEQTRDRLASYAASFQVPFEFNVVGQNWDTIKIEDLHLREDEVLVVNCLYHLRKLLNETVVINSPRNTVFNLIKQMNPHTFIMGTVNGPRDNAFFNERFQLALSHYSLLFEMLDDIIPRGMPERMLLERDFFAKEAKNVIACEGDERVERPETYKQWHVITQRLGFKQLPLNKGIVDTAKESLKAYHEDFMIYTDRQWLLQIWRGHTMYALSSWRSG